MVAYSQMNHLMRMILITIFLQPLAILAYVLVGSICSNWKCREIKHLKTGTFPIVFFYQTDWSLCFYWEESRPETTQFPEIPVVSLKTKALSSANEAALLVWLFWKKKKSMSVLKMSIHTSEYSLLRNLIQFGPKLQFLQIFFYYLKY